MNTLWVRLQTGEKRGEASHSLCRVGLDDDLEHIGSLFRGPIDGDLMTLHLKGMLRAIISSKVAP